MSEQLTSGIPVDIGLLEAGVNLCFLGGIVFVYQSSSDPLYKIGLLLLVLGTIGTIAVMLLKRSHWLTILERLTLVGMMIGILGMFQSWNIALYENGFYLLGLSTLAFIIVSHIPAVQRD